MKDLKPGDRVKFTRKSVSFHFDNLWKRGVAPYHLPLIALTLNREYQLGVNRVTAKYMYKNMGRSYRLSFTLVGMSIEVWWHAHRPKEIRIKL